MYYKPGQIVNREIAGITREVLILSHVNTNEYRVFNYETQTRYVIQATDITGVVEL